MSSPAPELPTPAPELRIKMPRWRTYANLVADLDKRETDVNGLFTNVIQWWLRLVSFSDKFDDQVANAQWLLFPGQSAKLTRMLESYILVCSLLTTSTYSGIYSELIDGDNTNEPVRGYVVENLFRTFNTASFALSLVCIIFSAQLVVAVNLMYSETPVRFKRSRALAVLMLFGFIDLTFHLTLGAAAAAGITAALGLLDLPASIVMVVAFGTLGFIAVAMWWVRVSGFWTRGHLSGCREHRAPLLVHIVVAECVLQQLTTLCNGASCSQQQAQNLDPWRVWSWFDAQPCGSVELSLPDLLEVSRKNYREHYDDCLPNVLVCRENFALFLVTQFFFDVQEAPYHLYRVTTTSTVWDYSIRPFQAHSEQNQQSDQEPHEPGVVKFTSVEDTVVIGTYCAMLGLNEQAWPADRGTGCFYGKPHGAAVQLWSGPCWTHAECRGTCVVYARTAPRSTAELAVCGGKFTAMNDTSRVRMPQHDYLFGSTSSTSQAAGYGYGGPRGLCYGYLELYFDSHEHAMPVQQLRDEIARWNSLKRPDTEV